MQITFSKVDYFYFNETDCPSYETEGNKNA